MKEFTKAGSVPAMTGDGVNESNIMQLPPRNVKTDKLTSVTLLFYSYFQAGLILTGACYLVHFRIFNHYGVATYDLFVSNNKTSLRHE